MISVATALPIPDAPPITSTRMVFHLSLEWFVTSQTKACRFHNRDNEALP